MTGTTDSTLIAVLRLLRERWWVIAVSALVCAAAATALALSSPERYEATSRLLLEESNLPATVGVPQDSQSLDPEADRSTDVLLVTSSQVARAVQRRVGGELTADELVSRTAVATASNANVLEIVVTDEDPKRAAAVATAFAEEYRRYRQSADRAEVREGIALIRRQLAELGPDTQAQRDSLEEALTRLSLAEAVQTGNVRVIDRAGVPTSPSAPAPRRDAVIAFVLGALLGVGIVFLLSALDRRVRSLEEFERHYGLKTLAAIPQIAFEARSESDKALGFEPYRVLRSAIGFAELNHRLEVIMLTSAMPAEGKSTVAMNLARAIALSGQKVVLVECDLRRPSLGRYLEHRDQNAGLTTALVGGRPVHELLQPVVSGLRHLSILPSGPLPPNAAELLRSPRMGALLEELKAGGSRIILDAPPLLPVADAQSLLDHPQIDAALLVARIDHTTREEAKRARAVLDRHRLQPLGLVVTGGTGEQGYGYYGLDQDELAASAPPARSELRQEVSRS